MQKQIAALLATTALAFTLAACGTDTAPSSPTSDSPAAAAAQVEVVSDPATIGTYVPASAAIKAGETVRWTFVDKNPHSITADDGSFDSTPKAAGANFAHKFDAAGSFKYHCSIHPEMHGTVVVG